MTYLEASQLRNDQSFTNRVRVAVAKWQDYLINTGTGDPEFTEKVGEGVRISNNFEGEVSKCVNALVGDTEVLLLESGTTVTDATLSALVEKYIRALSPLNTAPAMMMAAPGQTTIPTKWEAPKFLREARTVEGVQ